MLNTILRSPIFPMINLILITCSLSLLVMDISLFFAKLCALIAFILSVFWMILINIYNHKNPKDKIKLAGYIPYEFREMDEGQQWVTFKACRNVYIYFTMAIPAMGFICFVFSENSFVPFVSLGALGIGQYLVYWLSTFHLLKGN